MLLGPFLLIGSGLGPAVSATGTAEAPNLFPNVPGWVRPAAIQSFSRETLFDYIDGAAERYFQYGFEELHMAEYRNAQGDLIVVEIYRHSSPLEAFGIYSQEQPSDPAVVDIGARAYLQGSWLNFVAGPYYVKILSYQRDFQTRETLRSFAAGVAENLNVSGAPLNILHCFPERNKRPHSEKYSPPGFLGYSFLPSGITAEYGDSTLSYKIFIVPCEDSTYCRKAIGELQQASGGSRTEAPRGQFTLEDPHHGNIAVAWRGRYIWGILGAGPEIPADEYLSLTEELLVRNELLEN
jgi:hypothetical protein